MVARTHTIVGAAVAQWRSMPEVNLAPLLPSDPPHIDEFWLDARLHASPSGVVYIAHGRDTRVRLILLSDGAANDKAARDRFSGLINGLHIDEVVARGGHDQDQGRLGRRFRAPKDSPLPADSQELAPWVAMPWTRDPQEVEQVREILQGVELEDVVQPDAEGPDYEHYWLKNTKAGRTRTFPLPWPGRSDRAGWLSILTSWLLMLLFAVLALLIAYLLFRESDPVPEPSPVPQSGEPTPSSTASPSDTASPSESPEPSESQSPSDSASPTPSDTAEGTPTPPSRL